MEGKRSSEEEEEEVLKQWQDILDNLTTYSSSIRNACSFALKYRSSSTVRKLVDIVVESVRSAATRHSAKLYLFVMCEVFKQEYDDDGPTPVPDSFRALSGDLMILLAKTAPISDYRKVVRICKEKNLLPVEQCEAYAKLLHNREERHSDSSSDKDVDDADSFGVLSPEEAASATRARQHRRRFEVVPWEDVSRIMKLDVRHYKRELENIYNEFRENQQSFDHSLDEATAMAQLKDAEERYFKLLWKHQPPFDPRMLEPEMEDVSSPPVSPVSTKSSVKPVDSPPVRSSSSSAAFSARTRRSRSRSGSRTRSRARRAAYSPSSHSASRSVSPESRYSPEKSSARHHRDHRYRSHSRGYSRGRDEGESRKMKPRDKEDEDDKLRSSRRRKDERSDSRRDFRDDRMSESGSKRYSQYSDKDRSRRSESRGRASVQHRYRSRSRSRSRDRSRSRGRR